MAETLRKKGAVRWCGWNWLEVQDCTLGGPPRRAQSGAARPRGCPSPRGSQPCSRETSWRIRRLRVGDGSVRGKVERVAESGESRTQRHVVRLELLLDGRLGIRQEDRGEGLARRSKGLVVDARDLGTERDREGRLHVRNLPTDAWGGDATVSRAAGEARSVGGLKFESKARAFMS